MSTWHVWGDYLHTQPHRIGNYVLEPGEERAAIATAKARGFDFDRRTRNGFEPWAAAFRSDGPDDEFALASCPTVRGWHKL
ncbi:MAG TPA: hypothetical protein VMF61_15870 [Candidatus Acidoferrales bacterium]|nr:hypothetical protein [Candidatus Acidoferrales bacterium]